MAPLPQPHALTRQVAAALTTSDRIWEAVRHPLRGIEVRAWLEKRPEWFLSARGQWGETPLHWAAVAEFGLILAEVAAGLDPNALDHQGKSPLDWLNDRLVAGAVIEPYKLPAEGRRKLVETSEEIGLVLWAQGGRQGTSPDSLHPGRAWMGAGAWALLTMWGSLGPDQWFHWTANGAGALHHWGVAPDSPAKEAWLQAYLKEHPDADPVDQEGRTPLWYLADAVRARPQHRPLIQAAWDRLVQAGADPDRSATDGSSPALLWAIA